MGKTLAASERNELDINAPQDQATVGLLSRNNVRAEKGEDKEDKDMTKISCCPNFNHRRLNPKTRFCLSCGEILNPDIPAKQCTEEQHSERRKDRQVFCIDCGARLKV